VARVSERQNFETLRREHTGESRSAVGSEIHDLLAGGATVKKDKSAARIGFLLRRVKGAVHVPVVTIAFITNRRIGAGKLSIGVGRIDGEPFVPGEFQE
jgi:hypothetical protein